MFLVKFFSFRLLIIFASVTVSGRPPLFVITTAQPFADASRLVLPKGSSHLEQATVILVFLKILRTSLCFLNPSNFAFLWFIEIFSLFSSPIIIAFQPGYLSKILVIALTKTSYPFALFNLPTNVIHFFFYFKIFKFSLFAYWL